MFLQYTADVPADTVLVMGKAHRRIELYILENSDGRYSLVALAGSAAAAADKAKLQGPYEQRDQALAARAAIMPELEKQGFEVLSASIPVWQLNAQRTIRDLRVEQEESRGDYAFRPEDVYFD